MQSTLYVASSNSTPHLHHHPWNPNKTLIFPPNNLGFSPKPCSLKTPINYYSNENKLQKEENPITQTRLPVVIRQSGSVSRYIWDGNNLNLVSLDTNTLSLSSFSSDYPNGFRRLFIIFSSAVRNFFLPREISDNYLAYVKWKFLHRVFSSALQVLATQAMFRAIGVGYSHSLPSAAALNWVMKDGLGRLSRCIYTASFASAFDTNLKRVRFLTSVMFSLSIGVELLTPAFPEYFLLLASIANIAKQISLACYLATSSAVHRSFALADNLGEVSAKAQIQTVCFDNVGLMLAAVLNLLFRKNERLQTVFLFALYPIFSTLDLFGIYQGLKHVHLQTLTKDRLEIIIKTWIQSGYVPSPSEVSKIEGIDFPWSKGREPWPIRIGCLHPKGRAQKLSMMTMQSLNDDDFYFISLEISHGGLTRSEERGVLLCLREGAGASDVITGLLEACYIREGLLLGKLKNIDAAHDSSDTVIREWFKLIEDCKRYAREELDLLNEEMLRLGWACRNILLSTQEQARYNFIDDD